MIDQLIRDFTNSIADAEEATATTIGNLRLLEADKAEDESAVREWGAKAAAASARADQLRAAGQAGEADRFDGLAKYALQSQIQHEGEIEAALPQIAAQTQVVEKLKTGLNDMRLKLDELKRRRDDLVARSRAAQAQSQVMDAMSHINVLDPTSELSRFEEKVRRDEARAAGKAELAASSLDAQFESLDDLAADAEVARRLAALKGPQQGAIEG
jgi:phage shock protein A